MSLVGYQKVRSGLPAGMRSRYRTEHLWTLVRQLTLARHVAQQRTKKGNIIFGVFVSQAILIWETTKRRNAGKDRVSLAKLATGDMPLVGQNEPACHHHLEVDYTTETGEGLHP